jgi:hypothetical protein
VLLARIAAYITSLDSVPNTKYTLSLNATFKISLFTFPLHESNAERHAYGHSTGHARRLRPTFEWVEQQLTHTLILAVRCHYETFLDFGSSSE